MIVSFTSTDKKIYTHLANKYKHAIREQSFFPNDILLRFTLAWKNTKKFKKRLKKTDEAFADYLIFHIKYHHNDCLSAPQFTDDKALRVYQENVSVNALFIYGQDMCGHPILWDPGLYCFFTVLKIQNL